MKTVNERISHPVIVTRDLDKDAIGYAREMGLEPRCVPVLGIRFPAAWNTEREKLKNFKADAWVFTSLNGVRGMKMMKPENYGIAVPPYVFAVGNKTAGALSTLNLEIRVPENRLNAAGTAEFIKEFEDIRSVVHFTGNRHRPELKEILGKAGIKLLELIVYETENNAVPVKSDDAEAILFFSPSGVESFVEENDLNGRPCFAIGPTTASALLENGASIVIQPEKPDTRLMFEKVHHYLEKNDKSCISDKK